MAVPRTPSWRQAILRGVGAPVTSENLRFLDAWAQAEGGSAANNPFNTTEGGHGAYSSYNSVGVKNYGTAQGGIQATIDTLNNGRYGAIISALRSGKSAMADAQAEATTPWGTGSLIMKVLGGPVTGGQPTGVTSPSYGGGGASPSNSLAPGGPQIVPPRPDYRQHIVNQRVQVLGSALSKKLFANAQELLQGQQPTGLKDLFTLAKGFQQARRQAPLGGTSLTLGVGGRV